MKRISPWFTALVAAPYLLIGGEAVSRFVDGYKVFAAGLVRRSPQPAPQAAGPSAKELKMLDSVTFDRTIPSSWFFLPASPLVNPPLKELSALEAANTVRHDVTYLWNTNFLYRPNGYLEKLVRDLRSDYVLAFKAYDDTIFPHLRHYPKRPGRGGSITNSFGWFSSEVQFRKQADTVRIGILGDSTSGNAIGRYLQAYLNAWASAQKSPLKYEVLNASRAGSSMADENKALQYELGPMGLDYVYLYKAPILPYREMIKIIPETRTVGTLLTKAAEEIQKPLKPLLPWSSLANHMVARLNGELPDGNLWEPWKPKIQITLPEPLQRVPPDVSGARSIPYWNKRLRDFEEYVNIAKAIGAKPIVSTERWFVPGEEPLKAQPNRPLFKSVNGPLFWPLTYKDIKKFLRLNNAIISEWAKLNHLALVDIDAMMPQDPTLYTDGGHDIDFSNKLRAWIVFQTMIPLLREDSLAGKIPKPGMQSGNEHPFIHNPPLKISRQTLIDYYDQQKRQYINWLQQNDYPVKIDEATLKLSDLPLASLTATDKRATITIRGAAPAIITTSPLRFGNAAKYPISVPTGRSGPAVIKINLIVRDGEVGIGLLTKDTGKLEQFAVAPKRDASAFIRFYVESAEKIQDITVTNHLKLDGKTSTVEINSIQLFQ
jgi:hypothetical protein